MDDFCVVIPTKNRPEKLRKCLEAIVPAQTDLGFAVWVCDSSPSRAVAEQVEDVCKHFPFVHLRRHTGKNVAAARNFCASVAPAPVLINIDDDVYVERDAIATLWQTFIDSSATHKMVAGSVRWGEVWSSPVVMRLTGYGRAARAGEQADFLIGAFFAYNRSLALRLPWNERSRSSDDRFMGALCRSSGVPLIFAPEARAVHDDDHSRYGIEHQRSHIYTNIFDACLANPNPLRMISYEVVGFILGLRLAIRTKEGVTAFLKAWCKGHLDLMHDWHELKRLLEQPRSFT